MRDRIFRLDIADDRRATGLYRHIALHDLSRVTNAVRSARANSGNVRAEVRAGSPSLRCPPNSTCEVKLYHHDGDNPRRCARWIPGYDMRIWGGSFRKRVWFMATNPAGRWRRLCC